MKHRIFPSRLVFAIAAGASLSLCSLALAQSPSPSPQDSSAPSAEEIAAFVGKLDAIPGFGGIAFGTTYSDKLGLVIEQDRGSLKIYKKKGEKLLLGPALLEAILYYFYDGKLYGVAFHTEDGQDSLALEKIFKSALGSGQASEAGEPARIWMGKKNGAIFELNPSTGQSSAFIFDNTLNDAYLSYESDGVQKAASQLLKGQ